MTLPSVHRVVTGHDAQGKSILVSNGPPSTVREAAAIPGMVFHEVWELAGTPPVIDNGADPTTGPLTLQVPPNGSRIRIVDIPPDDSYLADAESRMKELFKELNEADALNAKADSPHPMMHRSETIDYAFVIHGEVVLVMDDSEVLLKPGSVVVQRGTNHAWANRSDSLCRVMFIQNDAKYEPSIAAAIAKR